MAYQIMSFSQQERSSGGDPAAGGARARPARPQTDVHGRSPLGIPALFSGDPGCGRDVTPPYGFPLDLGISPRVRSHNLILCGISYDYHYAIFPPLKDCPQKAVMLPMHVTL